MQYNNTDRKSDTHIHGDMKCPQLLFVCLCSSILAETSCIRVDGYSCVTAYWNTVSCVLNITGNAIYQLKFTDLYENRTFPCPLVWMNHSYDCECKIKNSKYFSKDDKYDITICNETHCQSLVESFNPSSNIQLTPPYEVKIEQTPEAFNITWKSGYEDHKYFTKKLDYQLSLRSFQGSGSKNSILNLCEKAASIPRLHPNSYTKYCVEVRSKSAQYSGTFGKWSPSTCWKNEENISQPENENISVILIKSLAPVCVVVGVLLFVFYSPAARMKIKTLSHTPSPAPFFQPLFQQYEGNLQEWFSPQGKFALVYKTEEILTTDAVTVVPKHMTKDPDENQDVHNPSITQLAFTQCQTSYVGLPGFHEVSPPITMVCPGNTSYTRLPCSIWGINTGEVQVMSSPPKDILEISRCDSGCSCESLTESLQCSLPTSPVDDSSPPFYCNDYCVLNKTADGVVPVLASKVTSPNIPSDLHQEDES